MGAFQTGFSMGQRAYEHALAQKRQEEVDARRKVLEGRQDAEYNEAQNLKISMANAAKPAEVQGVTPTYQPEVDDEGNAMPANPTLAGGFRVNSQQFADQAAAEKFAAGYNAPTAQMQRVAGVLKGAGQIDRALDMEGRAKQAQAADIQLTQAQRQEADQLWMRNTGEIISSRDPAKVIDHYNKNYNDGMTAEIIPGKGGAFTVVRKNKDGQEVERGDFANYDQFIGAVLPQFLATRDPLKSMQLQWDRQEKAEARADREDGKKHRDRVQTGVEKLQDAQIDNMKLMRSIQERALQLRAQAGAGGTGGAAADAPIWDKDADTFLRQKFTTKDADGNEVVDGNGLQFAKTIALASSRDKFGGDTTRALGYAFEIDARIKADAGGDPAKIREGRAALLQRLANAPAPAAAPAAAPAPAPAAKATPAPAMAKTARSLGDASQFEAMSDAELARYVKAGNEIAKAVAAERRTRAGAGDRALMQEAASQGITQI